METVSFFTLFSVSFLFSFSNPPDVPYWPLPLKPLPSSSLLLFLFFALLPLFLDLLILPLLPLFTSPSSSSHLFFFPFSHLHPILLYFPTTLLVSFIILILMFIPISPSSLLFLIPHPFLLSLFSPPLLPLSPPSLLLLLTFMPFSPISSSLLFLDMILFLWPLDIILFLWPSFLGYMAHIYIQDVICILLSGPAPVKWRCKTCD